MESDNILVRQLDLIKYPNIKTLGSIDELSYEKFVDVVVFLLRKIPSVASRISDPPTHNKGALKYVTSLIPPIGSLGFEGELNFDHFLYPKAEKTRALIRFLLGKVPQQATSRAQTTSSVSFLSQAIQATQQEFTAALKNKEANASFAQSLPLVNRSLDSASKEKVEKISTLPKSTFLSVPILSSTPFSNQCGAFSLASLLAANDREANIDFDIEPPPHIHHLSTIAGRAFSYVPADISISTVSKASTLHLQTKSRLANVVRFEYKADDIKKGAAVHVPTGVGKKLDSFGSSDNLKGKDGEDGASVDENGEPPLTFKEYKELQQEQKDELDELTSLIPQMEEQINNFELSIDRDREEINKLQSMLIALQTQSEALEIETEKSVSKAKFANASVESLKQLRQQTIQSTSDLRDIAEQWEKKRVQLISQYRELASKLRHRNDDRELIKLKLAKLKRQIAEGDEKLQNAETQIHDLEQALASRGDQLKRHHYTEMIFHMISKIEKQEAEVEKVRVEIRAQHTRMNNTIETVKRTWQLLDETIYSEAKKKPDQWIRQTYKQVVELLTLFENISEEVEKSGKMSATMMELEAKVDRVQRQSDPKALEKILQDLQNIKAEIRKRQKSE